MTTTARSRATTMAALTLSLLVVMAAGHRAVADSVAASVPRRSLLTNMASRPVCPPEIEAGAPVDGLGQGCFVRWQHCSEGACRAPCVTACDCPSSEPYCHHNSWTNTSQCVAAPPPCAAPILFVHVPKTAGSSWRLAAAKVWGDDRMCLDYSVAAPQTSPLVMRHLVGSLGSRAFKAAALESCNVVGGHIHVTRYVRLFGLRRTVAFVREPLARIVSEWRHHRRMNDTFQQGLVDWALRGELNCGRLDGTNQTSVLADRLNVSTIPVEALGFVGVTERYGESLEMLNAALTTSIPLQMTNVAPRSATTLDVLQQATDDAGLMAALRADQALYARIVWLHEERKRIAEGCQPYAHGAVDAFQGGWVLGWAWWAHSDDPVIVRFVADGEELGRATAENEHALAEWNAPREGRVGFEFRVPVELGSVARVRCEVCDTGQLLGVVDVPTREVLTAPFA